MAQPLIRRTGGRHPPASLTAVVPGETHKVIPENPYGALPAGYPMFSRSVSLIRVRGRNV